MPERRTEVEEDKNNRKMRDVNYEVVIEELSTHGEVTQNW